MHLLGFKPRFFCILLAVLGLHSAAQGQQKGVPFFRSPDSPFVSGQAGHDELKKFEVHERVNIRETQTIKVEKDGVDFVLAREDILRLQDFVDLKQKPWNLNSLLLRGLNTQTLSLRTGPDWRAESNVVLPRLTRFHVIQFTKSRQGESWVQLETEEPAGLMGYAEASSLILASDFMEFVKIKDNDWRRIAYRENDHFVLSSGESWPLKLAQSFLPLLNRGIVLSSDQPDRLQALSRVFIPSDQTTNAPSSGWRQSRLSGHGLVYWKTPDSTRLHRINLADSQTAPQENGAGTILWGDQISFDRGQRFKHFLRWDELAHLLQIRLGDLAHTAPRLRLEKSEWKTDQIVAITLTAGSQQLHLEGKPFLSGSWHFTTVQ
jgi:hypothetical protein